MRNKLVVLLGSFLLSIGCYAQNTTVTATVVDGDSVTWANATWTIDFSPAVSQPNPAAYTVNGTPLSSSVTHQTGSLNSSGALSVVVYDSSLTSPVASGWRIAICPQSSGSCVTYLFSTAGGSQNISANLTSLIGQPRFSCPQICRGYNTVEASGMQSGSIFYNTVALGSSQYSGSAWGPININSAGGQALTSITPGAWLGTGGSPSAACDTGDGFVCTASNGVIKAVAGSSPGIPNTIAFTLGWATPFTNVPNCIIYEVYSLTLNNTILPSYGFVSHVGTNSKTGISMFETNNAPTASAIYLFGYSCQ